MRVLPQKLVYFLLLYRISLLKWHRAGYIARRTDACCGRKVLGLGSLIGKRCLGCPVDIVQVRRCRSLQSEATGSLRESPKSSSGRPTSDDHDHDEFLFGQQISERTLDSTSSWSMWRQEAIDLIIYFISFQK